MTLTYRKGTLEDSHSVFQVFTESIMDLSERTNVMAITGGRDPQVIESLWQRRKPMFDFLAQDAAQFWLAEENGKVVAYARSIEHDGVMDLTEFFVSPQNQSSGVGRELLARAFQSRTASYRVIIATTDERALSLYLKSGVYARFPIKYFSRKAEHVDVKTDLAFESIITEHHMPDLNRIDRAVIGHVRPGIHRWLATDREGFLYRRKGEVVGYGYSSGPFALLSDNDFPAVLAHAESRAAENGKNFGAETPLINRKAIQYFLDHKYEIDSFTVLFMSNEPFGKFENYLCFSPIFFM
jgi:predicted acetyltransferase